MTNAWLEAVARLRAPESDAPPRIGPPQTLTEVIEDGLRHDGVTNPSRSVDRLA